TQTNSKQILWVWLNLVGHRPRAPRIGGSNPSTQTIEEKTREERAGERIGPTHRPRRVRSPAPAPRRRSPNGKEASALEAEQCGFDSLHRHQPRAALVGPGSLISTPVGFDPRRADDRKDSG